MDDVTETDITGAVNQLTDALTRRTGRPRHHVEAFVSRQLYDLVDGALRTGQIQPKAERRTRAALAREIAFARRGRWRNHPQRRRK